MYTSFDFLTSSSDQKPNPETKNSEKKITKINLFILNEKDFLLIKIKLNRHFDSLTKMFREDQNKKQIS